MELVNLTPHPINLYGQNSVEEGPQTVIPTSGIVARISTIELGVRYGGSNMPLVAYQYVEYGRLEGIPPTISPLERQYIVSLVCALAARGRNDILAPYDEVRNESGTVIGCRYLQKVC
jgi:hypothetical protein